MALKFNTWQLSGNQVKDCIARPDRKAGYAYEDDAQRLISNSQISYLNQYMKEKELIDQVHAKKIDKARFKGNIANHYDNLTGQP